MEIFSVERAIIQRSDSTQPVEIGLLQEVSLDFSINSKEFGGVTRYAPLIVQADGKVSGKMAFQRFNADTMAVLLGATKTTGATYIGHAGDATYGDAALPIPTTPYQITPTPPSSGTFLKDGGVIKVGASELYNTQMTRVLGTPATGQYAESGGVYTFAAADAGDNVIIRYEYTVLTGNTLSIPNPVMGYTYPFTLIVQTVFQGVRCYVKIYNALIDKTTVPFKRGEPGQFDCDFSIFPDGAGNIVKLSVDE